MCGVNIVPHITVYPHNTCTINIHSELFAVGDLDSYSVSLHSKYGCENNWNLVFTILLFVFKSSVSSSHTAYVQAGDKLKEQPWCHVNQQSPVTFDITTLNLSPFTFSPSLHPTSIHPCEVCWPSLSPVVVQSTVGIVLIFPDIFIIYPDCMITVVLYVRMAAV